MTPPDLSRPTDPYNLAHHDLERLRSDAEGEVDRIKGRRSFWRELPFLMFAALLMAVLIKTFVVQAFWIPSSSMENTLQIDDRVLVNKLSYRFGDVSRGDVIVFDDPHGRTLERESVVRAIVRNLAESLGLSTPKSEFIKRVIAVGGETIEIRDNQVFVDGVPIDEPYLKPGSRMADFGPVTVPEGFVFVMGDNRNSSQDSRVFGPIPEEDIVGRAVAIVWPPSRWAGL